MMYTYREMSYGVLRLEDNKTLLPSQTDPEWMLYRRERNAGAVVLPEDKPPGCIIVGGENPSNA